MKLKDVKEIAIEKLKMVGLIDVENLSPAELSGGMKKRVGLARAIAHEPEILIYDEPTAGRDPITADAISDLIVEMRERLSVTSVDIWDFSNDEKNSDNPHVKVGIEHFVFRNIFMSAGADNILNKKWRGGYIGMGVRFEDEDFKYLFGMLPRIPTN